MSTAYLTLLVENEDGTTETIHAIKPEGEQMRACMEGDERKLLNRLSSILELLSTKQYDS